MPGKLYEQLRSVAFCLLDSFYHCIHPIKVHNTDETLRALIHTDKSITRVGDGELDMIYGIDLKFQVCTPEISKRMAEILSGKNVPDNLMVAIPKAWTSHRGFTRKSIAWWSEYMYYNRNRIYPLLNPDYHYYDAQVTRIYINRRNKADSARYFSLWKQVWEGKDVLLVEGEASRMGVGNDLLHGAKSVRRILCPAKNAYSCFEEIKAAVHRHARQDTLVLLLLGPTATLLAADLAAEGVRVVDTGNLDMEYEWLKMNATRQSKVAGKYTHEATGGNTVEDINDEKYASEIIDRVGC